MKIWRCVTALTLSALIFLNFVPAARACGASYIEPIFVFKGSPDLPFEEFAAGKIGIVQPTLGRKSLFIAYRYLNGNSFAGDEQQALVKALRGAPPEDDGDMAIKSWIAARKEFATEGDPLPEIYAERQYAGYDFFPNCSQNAFEVATETLKDRAARYGTTDGSVRAWLAAQDLVFENCAGGKSVPAALGAESPAWLRKDRDYQTAAAYFYSLNFSAARDAFEEIAADGESTWQQTADYLIGRTLVREASLTKDEKAKREIYEQAERRLQLQLSRGGQFANASQKLLSLVKYRLRPEERVHELGQTLSFQSGNQNLRQDLIDYVWLLDKFEARILNEEKKRKEASKPKKDEDVVPTQDQIEVRETWEAVERGELVPITFHPKRADGSPDYSVYASVFMKYDASEVEVVLAIEGKLGRKLNREEVDEVNVIRKAGLDRRDWLLAPNRKWGRQGPTEYEGEYFNEEKLSLDLLPDWLSSDDLSDWIFTFQSHDRHAFDHALSKWRDTDSPAWLMTAMATAEKTSPGVAALIRRAEVVSHDSPAFPTIAYHLVRLKTATGKTAEARKLLNDMIAAQFETLPISSQNLFLDQRAQLAENLGEFFKFSQRKPAAFYYEGTIGKIRDIAETEKGFWDAEYTKQTQAEYEQQVDARYQDILPWDNRTTFDESTADVINRHLPLDLLAAAARDPALPDYLRRRLVLAVWTRAVLLKRDDIVVTYAMEAGKVAPEMAEGFRSFLNAANPEERHTSALWIMLKSPALTPFVRDGIPPPRENEISPWEDSRWNEPSETEYNDAGEEVPKLIPRPAFITAAQSDQARKETKEIVELGTAEAYLSDFVFKWVERNPRDARLPEALYIVATMNEPTRYGVGDEDIREQAIELLKTRYPSSPWTLKAAEERNAN